MNPPDRANDVSRKFNAIGTGDFISVPQALFMNDPSGDPELFDTRRSNEHQTFTENRANFNSDYLNRMHGPTTGFKPYDLPATLVHRAKDYGKLWRHLHSQN